MEGHWLSREWEMMGWRELLRKMGDGILKRSFGLRELSILHLRGLGVLLQALINGGNRQGWLRLLHTVARSKRKDKSYFTFQSPPSTPKAPPRALHPDLHRQPLSHPVFEDAREQVDTPLFNGAVQGLCPISQLWKMCRGVGHR